LQNDYPVLFLISCLSSYIFKNFTSEKKSTKNNNCIYVKTTFLNEFFCTRFSNILKRLNLNDVVKFYYTTNSLDSIFKPPKEKNICDSSCKICKLSNGNICFLKNTIYNVECNICKLRYIGQSSRLLKTRIFEHFTKSNSAVFQHHFETYTDLHIFDIFNVTVLHANIVQDFKRLFIESYYIKKHRQFLMNGCVSVVIPEI